ncbi:MAG: DUF2267 domain-containing protein [Patescibacteria group bacterium]|nr:DUF2267 domain-containing protein [Patescibacteria group bacterium]
MTLKNKNYLGSMSTGLDSFDETLQTTNIWLKEVEEEFGWQGRRDQAYQALRSVLQTLRDRLTIEEATDLAAQLPMLMRGFYYEGWRPSQVPQRLSQEEFLNRIRQGFPYSLDNKGTEEIVRGVINVVSRHVSQGELMDILDSLPEEIGQMF